MFHSCKIGKLRRRKPAMDQQSEVQSMEVVQPTLIFFLANAGSSAAPVVGLTGAAWVTPVAESDHMLYQ